MSFFEELKRRNVVKVGIAYLVAAWLLLQLTEVLTELLELDTDIGKIVILLLIIGFIPALIFAWAFEMTPEGIKREKDVDRSQSVTRQTGQKLNIAVIVMLAMIAGYFIWESRFKLQDIAPREIAVSEVSDAVPAASPETAASDEATIDRNAIAVLPFANRSNVAEDLFFTDGIHDDLLTQLAKISDLKVISRTSVMEYRDTDQEDSGDRSGAWRRQDTRGRRAARRGPHPHQCTADRRGHRPAPVGGNLQPRDDDRQHL